MSTRHQFLARFGFAEFANMDVFVRVLGLYTLRRMTERCGVIYCFASDDPKKIMSAREVLQGPHVFLFDTTSEEYEELNWKDWKHGAL